MPNPQFRYMVVSRKNNAIIRFCFYAVWLAVSLLQAYYTGLLADEAYYWKYAQDLQWGYFDHPPVVATLIKPGYWLIHNEVGVRLLSVLAFTAFLYLLELLVRPKQLLLYYFSVASIGAFHFLGFLALPDVPLLLFSACFLYLYRIYLDTNKLPVALLLAVTTSLLLLSKYHGILLVGFTILSNPALLKRKTFWLITIVSFLLFVPHIQWQLAHDLPSIKYHLYERSGQAYQIEFTLNYLLSVLLMFGPLTGIVFAWHALKNKTNTSFDRTLKYILAGTLLFFLVMTYKGHAEANWVACALIPAVMLGYNNCTGKKWFPNFTAYSFAIAIVLVAVLRLYLVYDFLPEEKAFQYVKEKIHGTKQWADDIHNKAGARPVVFMNKYQYAAWYEFYTGMPSISLNNRMGRKNQYNIWNDEQRMQGKDVMLVTNYHVDGLDSVFTPKGAFQYKYIDNFRSSSDIKIIPEETAFTVQPSGQVEIPFSISGAVDSSRDMEANPNYPGVIHAMVFAGDKFVADESKEFYIKNAMIDDGRVYTVSITAPGQKGKYNLYLDVAMGWLPASINCKKISLQVE